MSMKSVAIVLSTYNGEKFLAEQLESIKSQTYQNIRLYIHDDGSTDGTKDIIAKYVRENVNFCTVNDVEGLGYPACFIRTLQMIPKADYYAFADQDDVWEKDKIERAIGVLNKTEDGIPVLFYSSVNYCDEKLNHIRSSRFAAGINSVQKLKLQDVILGGEAMGMTYVFNDCARNAIIETNKQDEFKDWFLKLYCAAMGEVYYDPNPSAEYRRHTSAVTNGSNPSGKIARYIGQFYDIFLKKDGFEHVDNVINYLFCNCISELHGEDKELIELFAKPNTIRKRAKKLFWKKRFRRRLADEIGYRMAFLIGRI